MFLEGNSVCFDFSIHKSHRLFKIHQELLHEIIQSMKGITISIFFFILSSALCVFVFDRILLTCGNDYQTEALSGKTKILLILGGDPITIAIMAFMAQSTFWTVLIDIPITTFFQSWKAELPQWIVTELPLRVQATVQNIDLKFQKIVIELLV